MPSFFIHTFGCQMNVHDSARMREVFLGAGFDEQLDAAADVVVLNTCSVREKAEQKLRSEVGRLFKKKTPGQLIVVAGCVAQQEGNKLLKELRGIDLVVGPDNIVEIPRLLEDLALGGPPTVRTVFDIESTSFLTAVPSAGCSAPLAFVTVMKGCDERCSFCIVPTTRGPERYRPSGEVVGEIAALVASGVREVTLLGQTVNSYRDPSRALAAAPDADLADPDESEFAALLRRIEGDVPELARLRYTSPHPRHLTPSLIRAHAEVAMLARHVHLPVQSGSDRVLKRMIRRYKRAEFVERVGRLKRAVPGVTLSTDVIVGFPGETEDDFALTLDLVREIGFVGLFGFKYSPRPETPALRFEDDVPEIEKAARLARLFEVSEALIGEHLVKLVGSEQRVLIEGADKQGRALWSGRTGRNEIVHVEGADDLDLLGAMVDVAIVSANKHSLVAELSPRSRAAAKPKVPATTPVRRALPVLGA